LVARLNQQLGKSLGLANAALYGTSGNGFRDITQGNNGTYQAGTGWDACTGWGSPNGAALLGVLSGTGSGNPAPVRHRKPPKPGKPKPKKPKPKPKRPKPGSSGSKRQ
jgi:kumamolisin